VLTIDRIKADHERAGGTFFKPENARFFNSRTSGTVYSTREGSAFFVTSESGHTKHEPRLYTVRRFDPRSGDVQTFGRFRGYTTRARALGAAFRAARDWDFIQRAGA
jgi:hypothetical protein